MNVEPSCEGSVTECLQRVKLGESFAQQELWDRYLPSLLKIARSQLRGIVDATLYPDDVASIVYHRLLRGIQRQQIRRLQDRDDLWQVLLMLTKRASIDGLRRVRAAKRGKQTQAASSESSTDVLRRNGDIAAIVSPLPTPDESALLSEQFNLRLAQLEDPSLRRVALAKLSGFNNQEIAAHLSCSLRSVERKLALIRRKWSAKDSAD